MIPTFSMPFIAHLFALAGLVALPLLWVIYALRNRFRHRPVSSLMLWQHAALPCAGSQVLRRTRLPPIFLLELAILTLLTLAAAGPACRTGQRPGLTVVLDDSASMTARDAAGETAHTRAIQTLREVVRRTRPARIRFILAGEVSTATEAPLARALAAWRPQRPDCDLAAALALAGTQGGASDRVLVLTDHPPPAALDDPRVHWVACGQPAANLAIVQAARAPGPTATDRCLFEIMRYGSDEETIAVTVQTGRERASQRVAFGPDGTAQLRLEVPPEATVTLSLPTGDALTLDDQAMLAPVRRARVRVQLAVSEPTLSPWINRAVQASGLATLVAADPDLLVTDARALPTRAPGRSGQPPWSLHLWHATNAVALAGPYLVHPLHPAVEGLSADGIVWGAADDVRLPGESLVDTGARTLFSCQSRPDGVRAFHLQFNPAAANLHRTAAWPTLVWNILRLRGEALPGPTQPNLRLGQPVRVQAPSADGASRLRLRTPAGTSRDVPVKAGTAQFVPDELGLWQAELGADAAAVFAVSFLGAAESDLHACVSGEWGARQDPARAAAGLQSLATPLALLAVVGLAVHQAAITRRL